MDTNYEHNQFGLYSPIFTSVTSIRMLFKLPFHKGKKSLLNHFLSALYSVLKPRKPLLVLEASVEFHLKHFEKIIEKLSFELDIEVIVVTPVTSAFYIYKNVDYIPSISNFPMYKKADLFISTELRKVPYWFDCPSVYFGHGMGPKLNYVNNRKTLEYDYIFSPCAPTYNVQKTLIPPENVFPIGMPILDCNEDKKEEIYRYFALTSDKPLLVYAPSWCNDANKISDITKITSFLEGIISINLIISPHPLLFDPEKCGGRRFFSEGGGDGDPLIINRPDSGFSTLDLITAGSIVLSDISSILFEAMALQKKVLFDGNKDLYEYADAAHIYEKVMNVCKVPNFADQADSVIDDIIESDELVEERNDFISSYLFNNGTASDVFVRKAKELMLNRFCK